MLVGLSTLPQVSYAQSPSIRSEVDRTELTTDEVLTLTITVTGGNSILGPLLPALENVNIVGRSTVSQTTIVDNRTTSELVHEYRLRPTIDGPLTIGAVRVTIDGQTYETDPITVQVHPGSRQPTTSQPALPPAEVSTALTGQDYFVEATVDNDSPRIGEQVVYTFKFYSAASFFGRSDYDGPELTGFWAREDPDQRRYRTVAADRRYTVAEIRTVLFPTVVGPRSIEPAEITIPGGFFQQATRLRTLPVEIDVQPLPPGAPADFSGAVGRFSISAKTDTIGAVVNEPLALTVTLSGEGNIDVLPNPVWTDMADWRTVDAPPTTNSRIEDGGLIGTRVYQRTLVPREAGDFTIPAVTFTYFDPKVERYLRISTDPIPVTVVDGPAQSAVPRLPDVDRDAVERLASDIRHIKPAPGSLSVADGKLAERGSFWAAMALPAAVLAGAVVWRRRQSLFGGRSRLTRSGRAYGRARSFLESSRETGADPYEASAHALTQYLGDKLDQPATGLTHDSLVGLLRSRGIASELVDRTAACLVSSEGGRFAPQASGLTSGEGLVEETEAVLSELERQFESDV